MALESPKLAIGSTLQAGEIYLQNLYECVEYLPSPHLATKLMLYFCNLCLLLHLMFLPTLALNVFSETLEVVAGRVVPRWKMPPVHVLSVL